MIKKVIIKPGTGKPGQAGTGPFPALKGPVFHEAGNAGIQPFPAFDVSNCLKTLRIPMMGVKAGNAGFQPFPALIVFHEAGNGLKPGTGRSRL